MDVLAHAGSAPLAFAPVAALALLVVGAATTVGHAAATGGGGPLRDDNWTGTHRVGATIDLGGSIGVVVGTSSGSGTFSFTMLGGVADGIINLTATSDVVLEASGASGSANSAAAIAGANVTANLPFLHPQSADIQVDGTVTVNGFAVPIDASFDIGAGPIDESFDVGAGLRTTTLPSINSPIEGQLETKALGLPAVELTVDGSADPICPNFVWIAPLGSASYDLVVQTADGTPMWGMVGRSGVGRRVARGLVRMGADARCLSDPAAARYAGTTCRSGDDDW